MKNVLSDERKNGSKRNASTYFRGNEMKPRRRKVNRLDDRGLRCKGVTTTARATDSLASAMKNLVLGNPEATMAHLIDCFDHIRESKNVNDEVWRRYGRKKRDDRRKAIEIKALKQSPPITGEHYGKGMAFALYTER